MSYILPTSKDSTVPFSHSGELDEYNVDSDFEAMLISQTEAVEKAVVDAAERKAKYKATKCKVKAETVTPTLQPRKSTKYGNAASLPEPLISDTDEDYRGHGPTLAAIDPVTNSLVYPMKARRKSPYLCPDCKGKVHLKAGAERRAHFAHYRSDTSCTYYARTHPGESKEHKNAKQWLKVFLESRREIIIRHLCSNFNPGPNPPRFCHGNRFSRSMEKLSLPKNERVVLEYHDPGRKWVADLAVLNEHGEVRFIIEVQQSHSTTTERPEPWFEVCAADIKKQISKNQRGRRIKLKELRQKNPRICDDCKRIEEPWAARLKILPRIHRADGGREKVPCLFCGQRIHSQYQCIRVAYHSRQVCKTCFRGNAEEIRARFVS